MLSSRQSDREDNKPRRIEEVRPGGSNPRKHLKRYAEEKREQLLSPAELKRFGDGLREMEGEGVVLLSAIAVAQRPVLPGSQLG